MANGAPKLEWDRVAALRPRLNATARMHRHSYRGVPWFVIHDGVSGKHVRIGEGAWQILGLMDGQRSLERDPRCDSVRVWC